MCVGVTRAHAARGHARSREVTRDRACSRSAALFAADRSAAAALTDSAVASPELSTKSLRSSSPDGMHYVMHFVMHDVMHDVVHYMVPPPS